MRHAIVILIVLILPVIAPAATLKIPTDYPTIQQGIDAAVKGDTVLVAPGTYVENIDFKGKAITVKSEQGAGVTVIDGNQAGSVVEFINGEDVDSVLEGFTVTNGNATDGGGIFCLLSSPTIMDITISENKASNGGGGMADHLGSSTVTKCIFSKNSAGNNAGGLMIHKSNTTLANCTIINNWSKIFGGGIISNQDCFPYITNNIISGNTAGEYGGGIYLYKSSPSITGNVISYNSVEGRGGGIFCHLSSPQISNNIIAKNISHVNWPYGGGIYCRESSSPYIANSTITNNTSTYGGGIAGFANSHPTVVNTILWDNDASTGPEIWIGSQMNSSKLTISYSDVKGGKASVHVESGCSLNWGLGMIDVAPLFFDSDNGDFHLTFPSPCKDIGDNAAIAELYDFEGDPRIAYGTVDMGADEFHTHLYCMGDMVPGGSVEVKLIGNAWTKPVGLWFGSEVLDPPLHSMWGPWYLKYPFIGPINLGLMPPNGVWVLSGNLPAAPPAPYSLPMQALIGAELSNLSILEVK